MDRQQADQLRAERAAQGGHWIVRDLQDGTFDVVELRVPGLAPSTPRGQHVESKPAPPSPDDPRQGPMRDVPPFGAA